MDKLTRSELYDTLKGLRDNGDKTFAIYQYFHLKQAGTIPNRRMQKGLLLHHVFGIARLGAEIKDFHKQLKK